MLRAAFAALWLQFCFAALQVDQHDLFASQHPSPSVPPHIRRQLPSGAPVGNATLHNQGLRQVAFLEASTKTYLGSPAIARLDADTLLASHDFFPEWGRPKATAVYASTDGGASWQRRAMVPRQYWSTLFASRGAVYLLGTDGDGGDNAVSVSRSLDGGWTWNTSSVLWPPQGCHFGTGSVPVLRAGGVLYRGMEYWCGSPWRWPQFYQALLISAPLTADLLSPAAWSASQAVTFDPQAMLPSWLPGPVSSGGYLEGNAVPLPDGTGVGLLLRCRVYDAQGRSYTLQHACLFRLRPSPAAASTDNDAEDTLLQAGRSSDSGGGRLEWQGFVDMPGGGNKFSARWDPASHLYLALTNPSIDRYGSNDDARNTLALVYSRDLLTWRIAATVLVPNDGLSWEQSLWLTGYQYADWITDGDDLLAVIRTAYDGADSFHNSNRITFKRIERYRRYLPSGVQPAS